MRRDAAGTAIHSISEIFVNSAKTEKFLLNQQGENVKIVSPGKGTPKKERSVSQWSRSSWDSRVTEKQSSS